AAPVEAAERAAIQRLRAGDAVGEAGVRALDDAGHAGHRLAAPPAPLRVPPPARRGPRARPAARPDTTTAAARRDGPAAAARTAPRSAVGPGSRRGRAAPTRREQRDGHAR